MRRLLRVNLSSGKTGVEDIPAATAEDFVGGRGFCAKYLYDGVKPGTDPLGPENKLLLVAGPLAGTSAQAFSKWIAVTKSPLSNTFTRSVGGGDFGAWLRWAGLELIILEGKAPEPSYLYIHDGGCEIRNASPIWGKSTSQSQRYLKKEHGPAARLVCIGPAAEKLVLYAPIICDRRAAGRGGTGTVMASKNLKAIVIESSRRDLVANPAEFRRLVRQQVNAMKQGLGFDVFLEYGTVQGLDYFYPVFGSIPMKNYRYGELPGWSDNIGMWPYAKLTQKHVGCYSCALKCGKVRKITEGPYAGITTEGPQFETAWAFSGPSGCHDTQATLVANHLCYELGLDTISTGNTIGFAYELFEKGILTAKDTDGLMLKYGDPAPMLALVEKIARREGVGDILAEGVKRAAAYFGKGSEQYAMHVKGLEMPGYDPRARKAMGMNFALSNMGACHNYGWPQQEIGDPRPRLLDPAADEGQGDVIKYNHDSTAALELGIACIFPSHHLAFFGLDLMGSMLAAATGVTKFENEDYLMYTGEKVYNLERCFNTREGFDRKDDALPRRMYTEPLKGGVRNGEVVRKPDAILDQYYDLRGWDRNGIPAARTLARLGLDRVDKDIARFRR
ncbi:MAG: aldehyde ferredoxin oxidoreductase family protein [Dehalococcoidia bacterium]|nr:aldehyde ferredoxin oxidoreductase family protein [Dehalococcoidia bacterium]